VLGVIGASDKTPLTVGTGNKEMHPVLLSLANIKAGVRMKATAHAFVLAAYLPIPKFLDVSAPVQAALAARIYHICLGIISQNLKPAERNGELMPDPSGALRHCHTPLTSWIGDLPEQRILACVLSNQSPFTLATFEQFGDLHNLLRRDHDHTLNLIRQACQSADPASLPKFVAVCQALGLNGVHQPFWMDWGHADPSFFLTVDILHAFHKFFFDHPVKWIINIMGGEELDRRIAALQPRVGVRHWRNGISKLKQVTGREHRDIQKIIVSVIAGAVPDNVLCAVRALVEFIFQAQGLLIFDDHLHSMEQALLEFHHYKSSVILAGGRRGKNGIIPHFRIPKLEGFTRTVWSTRMMGAPYQYTSDITERCHATHVKDPFRRSSRHNFHEQCCRFMDRLEKMRIFDLYVSLKFYGSNLMNEMVNEASEVADHYPEATWLSRILPPGEIAIGNSAVRSSLFHKARRHLSDNQAAAFTVTANPHHKGLQVDAAATLFNLGDLRAALGDFFVLKQGYGARRGQRKSLPSVMLPFSHVHIWHSFRMQQHSTQDERVILPSRTIQALPPSAAMQFGRCNTVLVNDTDGSGERTSQDSSGEFTLQVFLLLTANVDSW
jgi:hypothetical protein